MKVRNKKKRYDVVFLCQFFYPEHNSSATLPWDTAKYLAAYGMKVGAVCGYPKEYSDIKNVPYKEVREDVYIRRLPYIQVKRAKKMSRLINYFSFTLSVLLHVGELKNTKCVMVYSNPPVLPIVAIIANIFWGTKIVFVSYDVYPEIAYASGSLTPNSLITKVMKCINSFLYKRVSAVIALTDEMKEFLGNNRKEIKKEKISVIPNWAYEEKIVKDTSKEDYMKFGYDQNDFIVSYFGNMGICQDVETIIEAIEKLQDKKQIKFFIVGHGNKKEYFACKTKSKKNVQILDFLTGYDFESALKISSCGIVSLEKGLCGMCAPSKYYSYLQEGIPTIAIVEKDSYLTKEIQKEKIGRTVEIGDAKNLASIIDELAKDERVCKKMSNKASALYKKKYQKKIGLEKYYILLKEIIEK